MTRTKRKRFKVDSYTVPLESDPGAALAYRLEGAPVWDFEIAGFLRGDLSFLGSRNSGDSSGLYMLHPYLPKLIPVVFVHGVRFERAEKTGRDAGYFIDCGQQGAFVVFRRFVKTADFSHELERSSSNLFGGDGWIEIEESFDIPTHHYDIKVQNSQGTELCSRVTIHLSSILR